MGPALMPCSHGHGDPIFFSTNRPASTDVPDPAAGDSAASSCPKSLDPAMERRESNQQQGWRLGSSAEAGGSRDTPGAIPQQSSASSPPAAFGGDFMGLGGFGEDLVDNLFAPPSSSSRRHRRHHRSRAPSAGGTLRNSGANLRAGEGHTGANGPYVLPPIVLVAGISGESRGVNATAAHKRGSEDDRGVGRDCNNRCRGVATAAVDQNSSVNTASNDVYHAFINLGRRLPGRLRR